MAMVTLENTVHCGVSISRDDIYHMLRRCRDHSTVRRIESIMNKTGFYSVTVLCDQLIRLFATYGNLQEAKEVFEKVSHPSAFTWNAMLSAYEKHGGADDILETYKLMQSDGVKPDPVTFVYVLKACSTLGALKEGRCVHRHMIATLYDSCCIVGNTLMSMYAKCGAIDDAQHVFDRLADKTIESWGAMVTAYSVNGFPMSALGLFNSMKEEGIKPSRVVYLGVVKACTILNAIEGGKLVHVEIIKDSLELDCILGSALLDMYSKYGSMEDAHRVFDFLPLKDKIAWSALIVGYCQNADNEIALELFERMQLEGIQPEKSTFSVVLKACAGLGMAAIQKGKVLHDEITKYGFDSDLVLGSNVVVFYSKCGRLDDAQKVFDSLTYRDSISWGAIIAAYAQNGCCHTALKRFGLMQQEGILPRKAVFLSLFKACSGIRSSYDGRLLHAEVVESEMDSDPAIGNVLVDMYAKCGSLKEAFNVFANLHVKDVVSWGALIIGNVIQNNALCAMDLFAEMQVKLPINEVIYLGALKACSMIKELELARLIHLHLAENVSLLDEIIGSTLIDMYGKCGSLDDAKKSFDDLQHRDLVSWGTMMMGYVNCGHGLPVVQLFIEMLTEGLQPDGLICICNLKACTILGAEVWGKWTHAYIMERNLEMEDTLNSNIIDMYARLGSMEDAQNVFDDLCNCDVACWGALIAGYASQGNFTKISCCVESMQQEGCEPNDVIFMSILAACSQTGRLQGGFQYFQCMTQNYDISPTNEHYSCMLDLLARSGRLACAIDILQILENKLDVVASRSLLSSCRIYNNKILAGICFSGIVQSES